MVPRILENGPSRYMAFRTADDDKTLIRPSTRAEGCRTPAAGAILPDDWRGRRVVGSEHLFGEGRGYSRTEYCDVPSNSCLSTLALQACSDIEDGIPIHDVDLGGLVGGAPRSPAANARALSA